MTKCAIILPQPLVHCYIRFLGIIQHIYLSVLSENLKTSLCSRTTVFPGFAGTFSFGARLTPLNRTSFEEKQKQHFVGFCHSPFSYDQIILDLFQFFDEFLSACFAVIYDLLLVFLGGKAWYVHAAVGDDRFMLLHAGECCELVEVEEEFADRMVLRAFMAVGFFRAASGAGNEEILSLQSCSAGAVCEAVSEDFFDPFFRSAG